MRVLGFSEKWGKLRQDSFTTFRFVRKDKDWQVGELVLIVYKPRSKGGGEKLGIAEIISKDPKDMVLGRPHTYPIVTLAEANADGFDGYWEMWDWLVETYPRQRIYNEPMNKLTLRWTNDK